MQIDGSRSLAWATPRRDAAVLLTSIAFCGLGLAFTIGAARLDFGSATLPGPGMFPLLAAIVMTILSAAMGLRAFLKLRPAGGTCIEFGHRNSALSLAMLFAAALLFERIGALTASFVFVALLVYAFSSDRLWKVLIYTVAVTVLVVVGFGRFLGVALPTGPFSLF